MNRRVAAVDVALRKSGLVVLEGESIVHKETVSVKAKVPYNETILYWADFYRDFFAAMKPDEVVVEGRLEAGWSGASLAAIEAARTATLIGWNRDYDFFTYSPGEIKHWLTGKRNAGKAAVRTAAKERFGTLVDGLKEDELDAYVLARYHYSVKSSSE